VALAFVLLSSAGLLGLSLKRLLETDTGFRAENILTGRIALPWKNYQDGPSRVAFVNRLLPALRAVPGISHAAVNTGQPFTDTVNDSALTIEGRAQSAADSIRAHYHSGAAGEYWQAMGIPLIEGRLLVDADNRADGRVCLIDRALAERYWPGESPLGRRISTDVPFDEESASTIVGVVGSVKQEELSETSDHGAAYFPYANDASLGFTVVVRTMMEPAAIAPLVRETVLQLDPELPIDDLKTMRARIDESLVARRSPAVLACVFAVVALLLAAIGTYGVLAYAVSQRRREIGVRMALGALPGQIGRQFLWLGLRLLAVGTVLGVLGAWAAGRAMQGILFNVPSFPVATLAGTALVMGGVSLIASWLPASRASRVDPMEALRNE
jgi:predicted permease